MVTSTETWKNKTVSHINEVNKVFTEWSGKMNTIKDNTVGKDLAELSSQTAQLTNNAKELANKLLAEKGVIAALEQELDLVG
jgi:X-X-X-Leu-X-X-Gly heptad repeat protein